MYVRYGILLTAFCACLSSQPAREMRELAVTRASDAGTVIIHLRNEYSAPATAWILQSVMPAGGSRHYWNDEEPQEIVTPKPIYESLCCCPFANPQSAQRRATELSVGKT